MTTFYLDYENGNDSNNGSSWALAWKTLTNGATNARIGNGDVIRIAKSPAPYSIGDATWNNASKTVTLATAQTVTLDLCESAWTANVAGDTTVTLTGVATDAKQGSNCMKLTLDASPQTSVLQAYFATGALNLSSYQKISFWVKNSATISNNGAGSYNWMVALCSDGAGATPVNTFYIPAIPTTNRWVPLTLVSQEGGNLGNNINSIAIYTGTLAPTNSSNILVDDFLACTTNGLNLQSLISKNSAEQGGTEAWYGIQSIDGTTVLLDNDTNCKANNGRGYSGSTETVASYARETIKTPMVSGSTTAVQTINDGGTFGSPITFQGGYDTGTNTKIGETFFDGLNGYGIGLNDSGYANDLFDTLSFVRYYYGFQGVNVTNMTIQRMSNCSNNAQYGVVINASNVFMTELSNCNNNGAAGIQLTGTANFLGSLSSDSNTSYGVYFNSFLSNTIASINVRNNGSNGVHAQYSGDNVLGSVTSSGNLGAGVAGSSCGDWYILSGGMTETTRYSSSSTYTGTMYIHSMDGASWQVAKDVSVVRQNATAGGTGSEWKISITGISRHSAYPYPFQVAQVAVNANTQVTATLYFKKSHATDIVAALVCRGGQIGGVTEDVKTNCPSDTNRNQVTIQFIPNETGVVTIEAWAWWNSGVADEYVIVDDFTVSQA